MIKFKWETEFKETEIGEIPGEWEEKRVEEFYRLMYGITTSSKGYGNCRLLRMTDIGEEDINIETIPYAKIDEQEFKKYYLDEDDLVISRIANVGAIGHIRGDLLQKLDKPLIFGSYLLKFVKQPGKQIYNRFVYYFFISHPMQTFIESLAEGSTRPNTNAKVVSKFPLYYPPPTEQSRIATVLSWFDDLIENKKRQNEILEKVAMAIFKSWFVDFEPFKDEEFVYSEELGKEISKGWEVKPIDAVAEFVKGLSYRSNELVDNLTEGEIFITLKIFKRGGGFRPEYKYYRGNRYSDEQVVYDGDLVIALTDMTSDAKVVGAPALVILPPYKDKGILSLDAAKLNVPQYMKEYAYLYLKDSQEENSTFANGVNVLHLNLNLFKIGKLILIPPQPILQHFHFLVEPLFQKIILNQKQIMVLRKIRDVLLPQLVFGKLEVVEL